MCSVRRHEMKSSQTVTYVKLSTLLLDCPYSVEQIVKFALDIPTRQAEGRHTEIPFAHMPVTMIEIRLILK